MFVVYMGLYTLFLEYNNTSRVEYFVADIEKSVPIEQCKSVLEPT